MSTLLGLYRAKQARLKMLLEEAWPLEAELNELHRLIHQQSPSAADLATSAATIPALQRAARRDDITAQHIKRALLTGPLALKGEKYQAPLLVERCEDIPGADIVAVRAVLRSLVKKGFIKRSGCHYWRAA